MATSESDDFESADEELDNRSAPPKRNSSHRTKAVVDSESDDDTECRPTPIQTTSYSRNTRLSKVDRRRRNSPSPTYLDNDSGPNSSVVRKNVKNPEPKPEPEPRPLSVEIEESKVLQDSVQSDVIDENTNSLGSMSSAAATTTASDITEVDKSVSEPAIKPRAERPHRQQKQREPKPPGAKKLGAKITASAEVFNPETVDTKKHEENKIKPETVDTKQHEENKIEPETVDTKKQEENKINEESELIEQCWDEIEDILSKPRGGNAASKWDSTWDDPQKPDDVAECWEGMDEDIEIPEELKSDKKFKEVFKSDGWGDIEKDMEEDMTDEKILPVLDKLSLLGQEQEKSGGWGWGGWGVSSLINTASAGVTTLTNHMSQGLTMLEETIGAPDPQELAEIEKTEANGRSLPEKEEPDVQSQPSFGFGNLMSGVSSITKLVESTSNKVIAGGLDTLETIGKKTMEVLQDGDPGLKKKRAFFTQDTDKPILSQMLREAKDKAEMEEKTLEEKQLARTVHFESLFDDYQGLVHLEALEMLSKQCDIKIQQHMINLNADELCSMQETLEEVKELCDLGDEDEDETRDTELEERLKGACKDLGVNMTYDKLLETAEQTKLYLSTVTNEEPLPSDREVFQRAISTLAQFTANSVERFHKTAELILIKERRSTVNEADALVQLTNILSSEIGVIANLFADKLNERVKKSEHPESVNANITTIFLEAANASSYIQDAFKLLIPVLQVGAT